MAINSNALAEMEVLESYLETLPKGSRGNRAAGGIPCTTHLVMKMNSGDQDKGRNLTISSLLRGKVGGSVVLQGEKDKLYITQGKVDMCNIERRTPYTQYMRYHLLLASASGSRYVLEGKKIMTPYLGAWTLDLKGNSI